MQELRKTLEHSLNNGRRILQEMSEHWRMHTNRRTIIIAILCGIIGTSLYLKVIAPPEEFPIDELVSVPSGTSLKQVAADLEEEGVVRSGFALRILVTLMGHEYNVHAGDYLFKQPLDVFSVARSLSVGAYGLEPVRIRIQEGGTTKQMATIFGSRLQRFNVQQFLAQAPQLEGYLFPDTYFFLPNATETMVIEAMRANFDQKIALIQPKIASSTRSLSDIVTMASIVEREAYNSQDRRMIAGVLWNRIDRNMPLQVDVVFGYTLGKGTFQLTMKDLTTPSPYNTYINKGLPPTPIGSPSLDSLNAAVTPTKNDYLYFLADRSGVTHFCKTYACQIANKALYF